MKTITTTAAAIKDYCDIKSEVDPDEICTFELLANDSGKITAYRRQSFGTIEGDNPSDVKIYGHFMGRVCQKTRTSNDGKWLIFYLSIYDKNNSFLVKCMVKDQLKDLVEKYVLSKINQDGKVQLALSGQVDFGIYNDRIDTTLWVNRLSFAGSTYKQENKPAVNSIIDESDIDEEMPF